MKKRLSEYTAEELHLLVTDPKVQSRYWKKVYKTETCWNWVGTRSPRGYGNMRIAGVMVRAPRIAVMLSSGPIKEGMVVDHICFNHACLNPEHLRVITQKQNCEHLRPIRKNSTSGYRGVHWREDQEKWQAHARSNGKTYHGGYFDDVEEANEAAIALRKRLHSHDDFDAWADAQEAA